jgi:DNA-binding NtrC family response regulator
MSTKEPASEPTVLVVDDEDRVANCYKLFIDDAYDARVALGGQQAVERLDRTVEVVLLDRRMPKMHGHEVLDHIHDERYGCRVILVSALDPDLEVLDYQFSKYLKKPIVKDQLLDAIEQVRMLDRYERLLTRYYQTVEKYSIMQSEFSGVALEDSEEFQTLKDEITRLREEIDETLHGLDSTMEGMLRGEDIEI